MLGIGSSSILSMSSLALKAGDRLRDAGSRVAKLKKARTGSSITMLFCQQS
jgi:hypothetical protein